MPSNVTVTDLLADPQRAAELEPDQVRALLPQLGGLVVLLSARLGTAAHNGHGASGGDAMLTPEQAAAIANVEVAWIWRRARRKDAQPWVARLTRKRMRIRETPFRAWLAREGGGSR